MREDPVFFDNSRGELIKGILMLPEELGEKYPVVIFCHGMRSGKESRKALRLGKELTPKGIAVFAFDFSGLGESQGKWEEVTTTGWMDDLKSAIDFLIEHSNIEASKISVIGSSMGGFTALVQCARESRVQNLILISPVSNFKKHYITKFGDMGISQWKEKRITKIKSLSSSKEYELHHLFYDDGQQYDGYAEAEKLTIPTLVVHGDEDESVDIQGSKELMKHLNPGQLEIVHGADHRYTEDKYFDSMILHIVSFIEKHV